MLDDWMGDIPPTAQRPHKNNKWNHQPCNLLQIKSLFFLKHMEQLWCHN